MIAFRIKHQTSCSHSHEQNGLVERKHMHIVDLGVAMLAHASLPLQLWDEAFYTSVYLINRLPVLTIKNQSHLKSLFSEKPEYSLCKNMWFLVLPWLRSCNNHKLQPRSISCTFLGYNTRYKGYKYLASVVRLYVSINVIFDETKFPFSKAKNSISPSLSKSPYQNSFTYYTLDKKC